MNSIVSPWHGVQCLLASAVLVVIVYYLAFAVADLFKGRNHEGSED